MGSEEDVEKAGEAALSEVGSASEANKDSSGTTSKAKPAITRQKKDQDKEKSGMSQSSKDDLGVCLVLGFIVVLAVIVTIIKIIVYDRFKYPHLFGGETTTVGPPTTTSLFGSFAEETTEAS